MKPILMIVAVLALAVAGPACGKDNTDGGEKSAGAGAPQADPKLVEPATNPAPPAEEAAVPTAEDFEEQAEADINQDSLEKDVEKLEAEVGQ